MTYVEVLTVEATEALKAYAESNSIAIKEVQYVLFLALQDAQKRDDWVGRQYTSIVSFPPLLHRWIQNKNAGGVPSHCWRVIEQALGCQIGSLSRPFERKRSDAPLSKTDAGATSGLDNLSMLGSLKSELSPARGNNRLFDDQNKEQSISFSLTASFGRSLESWDDPISGRRYQAYVFLASAQVALILEDSFADDETLFAFGQEEIIGDKRILCMQGDPSTDISCTWTIDAKKLGAPLLGSIKISNLAEAEGKFPGSDHIDLRIREDWVSVGSLVSSRRAPIDRVDAIKEHIRRRLLEMALRRSINPSGRDTIVICSQVLRPEEPSEDSE